MSQTGVGVRVLIDGLQLDDGCFDWSQGSWGEPWTELRRNLFTDPRARTGTDAWAGDPNVPSRVSGSAFGQTYAERFTATTAEAQRGGAVVQLKTGTLYTARLKARGSASRANWSLSYRPGGPRNTTGSVTLGSSLTVDGTVRDFEFTFTTTDTAPGGTACIALVNGSTSTVGEWFEICLVCVEEGDTTGQGFFDGASSSSDPSQRYRWTGAANDSASVLELGTWNPGMLPEALSAEDGLHISWGRKDTMDQPAPSTCTFTVDDTAGNQYFDHLNVGSDVQVIAEGKLTGTGDNLVIPDGSDATSGLPAGWTASSGGSQDGEWVFAKGSGSRVVWIDSVPITEPVTAGDVLTVSAVILNDAGISYVSFGPRAGSTNLASQVASTPAGKETTVSMSWTATKDIPTGTLLVHIYAASASGASITPANGVTMRVKQVSVRKTDPSIRPTFTDPDFETEFRAVTTKATAGRGTRRVETGTTAAYLIPTSSSWQALLPPAELQPTGMNPEAWDAIPHLSPGEVWKVQVRLWVPAGVTVSVIPTVFSGPYSTGTTALAAIGKVTGAGAWVTVQGDVRGQATGWLGVTITGTGRGTSWAQIPAGRTWAQVPAGQQWADTTAVWLDSVNVLAPPDGTKVSLLVFAGRVTDLEAQDDGAGPRISVTAVDFLGDLGNRYIGDEPWPLEDLQTRTQRVLELAKLPTEAPYSSSIASTITGVKLTWEDVDHRAASGLLTDIAVSVDAVLWSATSLTVGQFVRIEDPGQRAPLYQLGLDGGQIDVVDVDPGSLPPEQRPMDISACDVLRDPVKFVLDVSDIATRSTVSWQEQTVDDDGNPAPTERTVATVDSSREEQYGTRNVSVQTMLTTQADATTVGERILARAVGQWRVDGLAVNDADIENPDAAAIQMMLALLDGVTRGGLALRITDLPVWSPLGASALVYLEGGEYTYTGGGWQLQLTVSRATGLGSGALWDQLDPAWIWNQWDPTITWEQLRGVAGPAPA